MATIVESSVGSVPALRFLGFVKAWGEVRLGEVMTRSKPS